LRTCDAGGVVLATVVTGAAVVAVPPAEPTEFDVEPLLGEETALPPLPVEPAPVEPAPMEPNEPPPVPASLDPPTAVVEELAAPERAGVEATEERSEGVLPPGADEVVDGAETSVGVAPSTFGLPFAQPESAAVASRHRASRWGSRWEGIIRVLLGR
jgi:hypothetical protein